MRTSRWLLATYAAIILFGIVTALPNLFSQSTLAQFPGWFPKQQVTLGLDLRGGSHLVLEVDARALIQERVQSLFGEARRALREAGIDTGIGPAPGRRGHRRSRGRHATGGRRPRAAEARDAGRRDGVRRRNLRPDGRDAYRPRRSGSR